MTKGQREIIADNLRAFQANFGDVRIEDSWIQYCYNIDYLNGWLYGVVQGRVRGEFKGKREV